MAKSLVVETNEESWLKNMEVFQQIASENYFLRYLELDDPTDFLNRRRSKTRSNDKPPPGRTLFTITKRLQRIDDEDFGFSLVWTNPPIIERVEPESLAERCGLFAGDSLIFIDKFNVVTMPKLEILNLIKQQDTLTLEIFRRAKKPTVLSSVSSNLPAIPLKISEDIKDKEPLCSIHIPIITKQSSGSDDNEMSTVGAVAALCRLSSTTSIETAKKKLQLVTFSKESIPQTTDNQRKKFLCQLIQCEQSFVAGMSFGLDRFVFPLKQRRDLISNEEHIILFQNIEDVKFLSETILEHITQNSNELNVNTLANIYVKKTGSIHSAYRKYCLGLKHANFVLVDKLHNSNYEFTKFITEPNIPRKYPDLTTFIHKPLHHFRDILKIFQMIASYCHIDSKEYDNLQKIITDFQVVYREITVDGMLEPTSDGKPLLLTLQDLESRVVFTKCKPFKLAIRGRQWIFGGDLVRMDSGSVEKPYWTLLFSDIIVFAKISRDRVLFITEEPIQIKNIIESCFTVRKKNTEFRLTVEPNRNAESPTVHCGPDLSKSPLRIFKRRTITLRAPTIEMKAVWQNLLTRQIFNINTYPTTPLSLSPLDSPDVGNIGALATSMASMKLSLESINNNQRNQPTTKPSTSHHSATTSDDNALITENYRSTQNSSILSHYKNFRSISTIGSISELPEIAMSSSTKQTTNSNTSIPKKNISDEKTEVLSSSNNNNNNSTSFNSNKPNCTTNSNVFLRNKSSERSLQQQNAFDLTDLKEEKRREEVEEITIGGYHSPLNTPETPSAQFSQTSLSFSSSKPPSISKSWDDDILEFDIRFHELHDTSFRNDVRECLFFKDDPFSVLPSSSSAKQSTSKSASSSNKPQATANTTSTASNIFDL